MGEDTKESDDDLDLVLGDLEGKEDKQEQDRSKKDESSEDFDLELGLDDESLDESIEELEMDLGLDEESSGESIEELEDDLGLDDESLDESIEELEMDLGLADESQEDSMEEVESDLESLEDSGQESLDDPEEDRGSVGGSSEESIDDLMKELELDLDIDEGSEGGVGDSGEDVLLFECPVCEREVNEEALDCPNCGVTFEEEPEEEHIEDDIEKDFQRAMEEVNLVLSDIDETGIPNEHFQKLIKECETLADSFQYTEAMDKVQEALKFGQELADFAEKLDELKEKIKALNRIDMNVQPLEEKIEKSKGRMKKGETKKAFSILSKAIQEATKREREEKGEIKKSINRSIQDLSEILENAKQFDISLKEIRRSISTSLELSRDGNVNQALDELEIAKERSSEILETEIDKQLSKLEEKKETIFDDKKRETITECIQKAKNAKEEGNFKETHRLIKRCESETKESELKVGAMDVDEIIKIKELSESIGIDCSEENELIEKAKEQHRMGEVRKSKKNLKDAKNNMMGNIPRKLQVIMKKGMRDLETAKKKGENISKPVSYLKQANLMIKKKNFVEALEYMKEFIHVMEEIGEEKEMISTTVGKVEKKEVSKATESKRVQTKREPVHSTTNIRAKDVVETDVTSVSTGLNDKSKKTDFNIDKFYEGSTNLLKLKDLSRAYTVFKKLVSRTDLGVCVTREYPEKAKKKYDLHDLFSEDDPNLSSHDKGKSDISMIWLSNIGERGAVKPKDLEKLSFKLESFITHGGGIILLNGFEYLVNNNNFMTVLHLIQSLKDQVAVGGSILIITVSPDAFSKSQMEQLEREVDEVFP